MAIASAAAYAAIRYPHRRVEATPHTEAAQVADQGAAGNLGVRLARTLEQVESVDGVADALAGAVHAATASDPVKNALSGAWLGHALHPMMTDLPIGFWSSAVLLDLLGGRSADDAADLLYAAGNLSALGAAATGLADWSDTSNGERRIGLFHAALNAGALSLFSAALLIRRGGARRAGTTLALAGSAVATLSAYLGGHLVYRRGVGVSHAGFEAERSIEDWEDAAAVTDVKDGEAQLVTVNDVNIMLTRDQGEICALVDECTHAGGPLHKGAIEDGAVTCPWHGSRFALRDGRVLRGPAAQPQPVVQTRVRSGRIEVRTDQP
jgi:nitrite reductase/ring-hydroxylating ferredoxin subunit/uncharacterized membrane protein